MANFVPPELLAYRYPDQENTPQLVDKTFLLSSDFRDFIFKENQVGSVSNITIPGAKMNNLFLVGAPENKILTTI
jgi:hypothetical protein